MGAKLANGSGACPVTLVDAGLEDVSDEIQVLVLFVLAICRSCHGTAGRALTALRALIDEDLEFVLDRILFLDAVERLAVCLWDHSHAFNEVNLDRIVS